MDAAVLGEFRKCKPICFHQWEKWSKFGYLVSLLLLVVCVSNLPWVQGQSNEIYVKVSIWKRVVYLNNVKSLEMSWFSYCKEGGEASLCVLLKASQATLIAAIVFITAAINVSFCLHHDESGYFLLRIVIISCGLSFLLCVATWILWTMIDSNEHLQVLLANDGPVARNISIGFISCCIASIMLIASFVYTVVKACIFNKRFDANLDSNFSSTCSNVPSEEIRIKPMPIHGSHTTKCTKFVSCDTDAETNMEESYDDTRYSSSFTDFEHYKYSAIYSNESYAMLESPHVA